MDEHLCTISAKVRDRLGLEHPVIGVNNTAKGLGKHFPKEAGKTSMIDRRGLAMKGGGFEKAGHGFQGKLAWVLRWSGLLSGECCNKQKGGVL